MIEQYNFIRLYWYQVLTVLMYFPCKSFPVATKTFVLYKKRHAMELLVETGF